MHTDEAVNAYIVGQMLAGEAYVYDPQDRHGPTLAALALPLARMQGAKAFSDLTESELRLAGFQRVEQCGSEQLNELHFKERADGLKLSALGLGMLATAWV